MISPGPSASVHQGSLARPHPITDESSRHYEGWRVAAASAVGVFVSFASLLVYTFGIFLKPVTAEFGWSREAASAAFGIAAITVAICSPGLGYLFDRVGPRRIILPCLTVFGCAFASLAWLTPQLGHLYAVFFVLGVVGNGTAQMAYSRAITTWFLRRRGLALALMMCGSASGAMILPPVAQALIGAVGWRNAFLTLGSAVLVIGLPSVALFVRERPIRREHAQAHASGASFGEAVRSRVFWIVVAVLFIVSIAQNGAIAHLSALLTDRGVSAQGGALALSALGGASLAGRLGTGWLLDRFPAGRVASVLLTASALGTVLLANAHTLPAGIVAAVFIGLGMGGEADVTPYILSRFYGLRAFAVLYGFTWTAYAIAGAIGPVLMGQAFDLTGSYEALLVRLSGATLVAAALMLLIPRTPAEYDEPAAADPVPA